MWCFFGNSIETLQHVSKQEHLTLKSTMVEECYSSRYSSDSSFQVDARSVVLLPAGVFRFVPKPCLNECVRI